MTDEIDALLLGDVAARIVAGIKPVDAARRRRRKLAVDEPNAPSLPNYRIAVPPTDRAMRRFGSEAGNATTRTDVRIW
jgi:hypothetical protein